MVMSAIYTQKSVGRQIKLPVKQSIQSIRFSNVISLSGKYSDDSKIIPRMPFRNIPHPQQQDS